MYWTEKLNNKINRASLDDLIPEELIIPSVSDPAGIALLTGPAPQNLSALSQYDRASPLLWDPPEGFDAIHPNAQPQSLKHYRIWRVDGSGFEELTTVQKQYYRDEDVVNGRPYDYKVQAYFEGFGYGDFSNVATATPGFADPSDTPLASALSGWATQRALIDGKINNDDIDDPGFYPNEWKDAAKLCMFREGFPPWVMRNSRAWVMNNSDFLYIAVEDWNIADIPLNDLGGSFTFSFDQNLDREWPPTSPTGEGYYGGSFFGPGSVGAIAMGLYGWWPEALGLGWLDVTGVDYAYTVADGRIQHELAINLSTSHLRPGPGDVVGALLESNAGSYSGQRLTGLWPLGAQAFDRTPDVKTAPFAWGDLELAHQTRQNFASDARSKNARWDNDTKIFSFDCKIKNYGPNLRAPVRVVLTDLYIVDQPRGWYPISAANADGILDGVGAYFDYSLLVGDDRKLSIREWSDWKRWEFYDPYGMDFRFRAEIFGVWVHPKTAGRDETPAMTLEFSASPARGVMEIEEVKAAATHAPSSFVLTQNHPNPFNPSTAIGYELPTEAQISMAVYNLVGQRVRTVHEGQQSAGYHTATWDATDDQGNPVASGVYLYRLEARAQDGTTSFVDTKKMILMR